MNKNWKNHGSPFLDFNEEITQKWKDNNFNKEQTREWLDIGLLATDYDMAKWLRDDIETTPTEILNADTSLTDLQEQYQEYLKKSSKPEKEEEIIPDWLFPEETEKPDKPTSSKSPKPPKPPKPPQKEKPHECRICKKNTFYSKREFLLAHHARRNLGEPSVWVYKSITINKKPIIIKYIWICKLCKQEYHTNKCKYYSPVKPIIPKPEPFDWENYWKWWFGVMTLDWDSKRFFG